MTTTENPLPAFLAVPDGEPEPVSEEALQWLTDRVSDEPEWTLDKVLASAGHESDPDDPRYVDDEPATLARFAVNDDNAAEWALRKLAEINHEGEEVAEQASQWISEIERWRDARMKPLVARTAFFEMHLKGWMRRIREANPKMMSRLLPSGRLSSTKTPAKPIVTDEAKLIEWAQTNEREGFVRTVTVTDVLVSEVRKLVKVNKDGDVVAKADGVSVPGVGVAPEKTTYHVDAF